MSGPLAGAGAGAAAGLLVLALGLVLALSLGVEPGFASRWPGDRAEWEAGSGAERTPSDPDPANAWVRTQPARAAGASAATPTTSVERRVNQGRSGFTEEPDSGGGGLSTLRTRRC
ncbi:hypothetical protein SAVIM40S_00886 [Streptomyces avidinii]